MTRRFVAPATVGERAISTVGGPVAIVPEIGGNPVVGDLDDVDVLIAVPDVLGRLPQFSLPRPSTVVVDRMTRRTITVSDRHERLDVGDDLGDPGIIVAELSRLRNRLTTAGGVRVVAHAPYAIPLIAPEAPEDVPAWCTVERPVVPGLPDLLVVRPTAAPPVDGRRAEPPALAVR